MYLTIVAILLIVLGGWAGGKAGLDDDTGDSDPEAYARGGFWNGPYS